MNNASTILPVDVQNPHGSSCVVVVCEHASRYIPDEFDDLGLSDAALKSHVAWDPGAIEVAQGISQRLDASLVSSTVSRLVYDCNRPPSAADAMPAKSEVFEVPGNSNLTPEARKYRADTFYEPFRAGLGAVLRTKEAPVVVTVHSFTPVYNGQARSVEIGVLHDADPRLADALLNNTSACAHYDVQRNAPYGPQHGVTHTLVEHALAVGHLNVMLEIRNDLIQTTSDQDAMAKVISVWVEDALRDLAMTGAPQC